MILLGLGLFTGWHGLGANDSRSGVVGSSIWAHVVHSVGVLVIVVIVAVELIASERDGGPACTTEWGETTLAATAGIDASVLLVADCERGEAGTYESMKKRKVKKRTTRTRVSQRPQLFQVEAVRRRQRPRL